MAKRKTLGENRLKRNIQRRDRLFPNLKPREIWNWAEDEVKGFATIPRTLPYIFRFMDAEAKYPLSSTYFALWCRLWDASGFIKMPNQSEMAMEAGFGGQRKISTWKSRMKELEALGFIKTQPLGDEQLGYVFIRNPYQVIKERNLKEKDQGLYNALFERTEAIKANDLHDEEE
ncbi:MAG: hypothetical protein JRI28_06660 [Deltaproteobacteria bacterium]|nr:hypothetical protein [Deltaproteobacteria bacterium]